MIISVSVRCDSLGEETADQIRSGVDVARAALYDMYENAGLFSRPKGEEVRFLSTDVYLPGGMAKPCGRITVAAGPRLLWTGEVDGVRTRITRAVPGSPALVETALGQDDRDDSLEPDEDGRQWEACDDAHALHAYEAALLSLMGDPA